MRNTKEEAYKELQGKVLHVLVKNVYPNGPDDIGIDFEVLEIGEDFTVYKFTDE